MVTIHPTEEQMRALAAADQDAPVVMLNLLRFEQRAKPGLGADGLSGRAAYGRYAERIAPYAEKYGLEVRWVARAEQTFVGPADEQWDEAILVRYPTLRAFIEMITDPGYLEVSKDRTAALADSRLIPLRDMDA